MRILLVVAVLVLMVSIAVAVDPTGADVTEVSSERATADAAGSVQAQAGNVTGLVINAFSSTQTWQGYYGNVSGALQLADANDNVFYNWSLASPEGEVYASVNSSITWANVQCFNFTATGTYADDTAQAGATSLFGTNLTVLESQYGINPDDVDGVNETFSLSGNHDLFYTAQREFGVGECLDTLVYGDGGAGVNDEFEEVLLYEPDSTSVIFASLLEPDAILGFDGGDHDFQMLVLEDGHGTDTDTTTYYFFVELE